MNDDELAAMRGILWAVVVSIPLWAVILWGAIAWLNW